MDLRFNATNQNLVPINIIGTVLGGKAIFTGFWKLGSLGINFLRAGNIFNASKVIVNFGKNSNQIHHAFRHIDELGLSRSVVKSAIMKDFVPLSSKVIYNKPFNQIVTVRGNKLQYTVYKLSDNTFNIGRIHVSK